MTDIPKDSNRAIHSVKEIDSDNVLRPNFGGRLRLPDTNTALKGEQIAERTADPNQQKSQSAERESENDKDDQTGLRDE